MKDKQKYFIIIKWSIHHKDIVYATNNRASKYMTRKSAESKNETFRIFIGDFNITLLVTDKTTRQKISEYLHDLNNNSQFHAINSSRTICTITTEYIFFSSTNEIFIKKKFIYWAIKQVSRNKINEIIRYIFWTQQIKLELSNNNISSKIWRYLENNTLQNNL